MRKCTLFLGLGLMLTAVVAGCRKEATSNTPGDVAKRYFNFLRDGKVAKAEQLATFESDAVKTEWEKQVNDYVTRLNAGGRKWWGQPFKDQETSGPPPGQWAVVEVQWRFLAGKGWMMGEHYTYKMRTVDGEWKMVMDADMAQRGIPYHHPDLP